MKDLSPAQNARVTAALQLLMQKRSLSRAELARLLGRSQPSLSNNLNGKNGFSWDTARRSAKLLGTTVDELVGPETARVGESLDVKEPKTTVQPALQLAKLSAGSFLMSVKAHPGLERAIAKHPEKWTLATVAQAVAAPYKSDSDGNPEGGWIKLLDEYAAGGPETIGGADELQEKAKKPLGLPPVKPKK